jgi:DNA-directed RNA polymerase specialized sigma24 family protein
MTLAKSIERTETTQNDFAVIYEQYINKIYNFVFRMTGSREIAEDISQELRERRDLLP